MQQYFHKHFLHMNSANYYYGIPLLKLMLLMKLNNMGLL